MILYKSYDAEEYPVYDNYEAINIDRTVEIPMDYKGVMGVPITFLDKYNPEQFEILGTSTMDMPKGAPYVGGKRIYERILIRRRKPIGDVVGANNDSPLQMPTQPDTYVHHEITTPVAAEDPESYNQNR